MVEGITTTIVYIVGDIFVIGLLAAVCCALTYALGFYANKLMGQLLLIRRLSYIKYWTYRLEEEGLLDMDKYYRDALNGAKPKTRTEAMNFENLATEAQRKDTEA